MSVHLRPEEIEELSFRIIEQEQGAHNFPEGEWPVVRRVIHTSADFEYARTLLFAGDAVSRGVAALRSGAHIVTDTNMALAGISKERLTQFGCSAACYVADAGVARDARAQGITRSICAMRKGAREAGNGVFVIGNAPTALFELIRLVREEGLQPQLIVALPVGFVGAAESKDALREVAREMPGLPFITNSGRKGGSNVAAAVVNALLVEAQKE